MFWFLQVFVVVETCLILILTKKTDVEVSWLGVVIYEQWTPLPRFVCNVSTSWIYSYGTLNQSGWASVPSRACFFTSPLKGKYKHSSSAMTNFSKWPRDDAHLLQLCVCIDIFELRRGRIAGTLSGTSVPAVLSLDVFPIVEVGTAPLCIMESLLNLPLGRAPLCDYSQQFLVDTYHWRLCQSADPV